MNIQTVIKGMGGLLGKTVKASMEDFKIAMIIIHQKEYMCIPSIGNHLFINISSSINETCTFYLNKSLSISIVKDR